MKRAALSIVVVATLAALFFLGRKASEFDDIEHGRFQAALWRVKHLNTAFNEDLLKSRFALLDNYDNFQSYAEEMKASLDALNHPPRFVTPDGRTNIEKARLDYSVILDERQKLFERFKTQNARVGNSRHYFPVALNELAVRIDSAAVTNKDDLELQSAVSELGRSVLMRLSTPEELPQQAHSSLQRLQDWRTNHPKHPEAVFAASLSRHAQLILSGQGEVDVLTHRLLALPSIASIEKLFGAYETEVSGALRRVQQYRLPLYALVFITLAGIGYSVWALRAANRNLEQRVRERTSELETEVAERKEAEEKLKELVHSLTAINAVLDRACIIARTDLRGIITYVNDNFCTISEYSREELVGQNHRILKSGEHPDEFFVEMWKTIAAGGVWRGEIKNRAKSGNHYWVDTTIGPMLDEHGKPKGYMAIRSNITPRKRAEQERREMEIQLQQGQKLESIGRLAAGVAHEINTPTQYIGDNTRFVSDSFTELLPVLKSPRQLLDAFREDRLTPELIESTEEILKTADVDYLTEEIPKAVEQSLQGVERVTKIVRAMKEFSHPGSEDKTQVDLNHCIDSTLTVARNEWKYVADLITDFDSELPQVTCLPGEFNQVILNLVVNAAHAIGDTLKDRDNAKGTITVSTKCDGDWVEVRIADTGSGIPEHVREKIFDPFFTTKGVGKGTGQGLTIGRSVIVDKHGGTITFETEIGKGTVFIIRIPINPNEKNAPETATQEKAVCA